jgi:methylenetetrahydrofolate dehydrogenase (NADP+)/methenyltetrahydrofolate cyclohydrolase
VSRIIDGKAIAAAISEQTATSAALLRDRGITPTLAVVVPTDDEGAAWYVRSIGRIAAKRHTIQAALRASSVPKTG